MAGIEFGTRDLSIIHAQTYPTYSSLDFSAKTSDGDYYVVEGLKIAPLALALGVSFTAIFYGISLLFGKSHPRPEPPRAPQASEGDKPSSVTSRQQAVAIANGALREAGLMEQAVVLGMRNDYVTIQYFIPARGGFYEAVFDTHLLPDFARNPSEVVTLARRSLAQLSLLRVMGFEVSGFEMTEYSDNGLTIAHEKLRARDVSFSSVEKAIEWVKNGGPFRRSDSYRDLISRTHSEPQISLDLERGTYQVGLFRNAPEYSFTTLDGAVAWLDRLDRLEGRAREYHGMQLRFDRPGDTARYRLVLADRERTRVYLALTDVEADLDNMDRRAKTDDDDRPPDDLPPPPPAVTANDGARAAPTAEGTGTDDASEFSPLAGAQPIPANIAMVPESSGAGFLDLVKLARETIFASSGDGAKAVTPEGIVFRTQVDVAATQGGSSSAAGPSSPRSAQPRGGFGHPFVAGAAGNIAMGLAGFGVARGLEAYLDRDLTG